MNVSKWLMILLFQLTAFHSIALMPVAPMEIENQGYWLPLRAVADYANIPLMTNDKEITVGKYTFKKNEVKIFDGISYVKSESFVNAMGGERTYRPDIDRTIIDIPGMPVPLSLMGLGYFPTGDKLYIQSKNSLKQLSVLPWYLYSAVLPVLDKNENMYWVNNNRIYYKPANVQNYQEIYYRLNCEMKIRGFDVNNNLICEIINDKPGEHEIWVIKNDGMRRLIMKGNDADMSSSSEMLAFCRMENNVSKIYLKSLLTKSDAISLGMGTNPQFAPDSASIRYYNGTKIVHISLINGAPGGIISVLPMKGINQQLFPIIYSYDNKYLIGKSASGILLSSSEIIAPHWVTGNPDDSLPQFSRNDILFLRENRLMKISVIDGSLEDELFPGLHISNYKAAGDKVIFTGSGTLKNNDEYKIDFDADAVIKVVEKTVECSAGEVIVEQITPEQAAGIIARKSNLSMQKETWSNAVKISQGMLGIFDEQSGKIFIMPRTIHKIAGGMDEKDIAKVVLAHELTHKIQHDVNSSMPADFDVQLAWAAVTEGQAMIIAQKAAIEMKISADVVKKTADYTSNVMPNKIPYTQRIAGQMTAEIYRAGHLFMSWQMMNGGNKKMWQIIRNPPLNTDTIYHPQNYPEKTKKADYSYLLNNINMLFPGNMRMINMDIGALAQRVVYNDMDAVDKSALFEHIKTVQTAALDNGVKIASVSVIILDNAKLTGQFISAAEKIALKNNRKVVIESFVSGDIIGRKMKNGNTILFRTFYNTAVIEINANGINLTDNTAIQIMHQIIGKLKFYAK